MPTISIRKTYLTFLEAFGSPSILVEDAVRKYVIDKTVERIERSREKQSNSSNGTISVIMLILSGNYRPKTASRNMKP